MITKDQKKAFFEQTIEEAKSKFNLKEMITVSDAFDYVNIVFIDRLCKAEYHTMINQQGKFKGSIGDLVGYHSYIGGRYITLIDDIPQKLKEKEHELKNGNKGEFDINLLEYVKLKHFEQLANLYIKAEEKGEAPKAIFCDTGNGYLKHLPEVWTALQ